MSATDFPATHVSATGVVFSTSRTVPTLPSQDGNNSGASSVLDTEKAESTFEDDEKALAKYLVPALEKGQKNARLKPVSNWIKFRVWYNPYRMARPRFTTCMA